MNAAVLAGARLARSRLDVIPTLGQVAMYDLTRVNLLGQSEGPLASMVTKGGTPAVASLANADGFAEWFGFSGTPTGSQYAYAPMAVTPVAGQTYTMSAYVRMDDGGAVTFGGSGGAVSFALIVFGSNAVVNQTVTNLGGGLYRVSATRDYPSSGGLPNNNGVLKYTTNDTRGFKVAGYQLNAGATALPYERTYDVQTVVDSSVKYLNLIPSSEDFSVSTWGRNISGTGVAAVPTYNAELAPDGTMTAARYVFDLGTGITSNDFTQLLVTGNPVVGESTSSAWLRTTDGSTKAMSFVSPSGVISLIQITPAWQRFAVSGSSGTPSSFNFRLRLRGNENTSTQASVAVWHPMCHLGLTALAYERSPLNAVLGTTSAVEATDPAVLPTGLLYDGTDDRALGPVLPAVSESGLTYAAVVTVAQSGVAVSVMDNKTQGSNNAGMSLEIATNGEALVRIATGSTQMQVRGGIGRTATGKPVLLVGVADRLGGQVRLYLGGELLATGTLNSAWTFTSTQPLYLGAYGAGAFLNGTLHFTDVINRALSTQEVGQLYRYLKKRLPPRSVALS